MICHNELIEQESIAKSVAEKFILLLSPFAPHIGEEIWTTLGHSPSILNVAWPDYDPKFLVLSEVTYAVQVNGKLRGNLVAPIGAGQDEVQRMALEDPQVSKYVRGEIKKVIFVPKRLINFVVIGES
jgi:leucyl-tRNA synthetase